MTPGLENRDTCLTCSDIVERNKIPSVAQCLSLLTERFQANPGLIRHSMKVAQTAVLLAQMLNKKGYDLDLELIWASSLLHDVARGVPNHARVAGEFLRKLGYLKVAEVVEAHMDPVTMSPDDITAIDIVSLSDRLVMGDQMAPLEFRFRRQLLNYGSDPEANAMIKRRFYAARTAQAILEETIGIGLGELFPELSE